MATGLDIQSGQKVYFDEFRNMTRIDRTVKSGCAVTDTGATMSVDVAVGTVNFGNVEVAVTAGSLAIAASDPSLDRFDLVVVNNAGTKSVLTGTPAALPVPPAYDSDTYVVLARVFVDDGATQINLADVKDNRVFFNRSSGGTKTIRIERFRGDDTSPPTQNFIGVTEVLDFDPSADQIVYGAFKLPDSIDLSQDITVNIRYTMDSSFAGDVKLDMDAYVYDDGDDLTPGAATESTTDTFTAVATAEEFDTRASTTLKISASNLTANTEVIHFLFKRDADAVGDTHTGNFQLESLEFQYTG